MFLSYFPKILARITPDIIRAGIIEAETRAKSHPVTKEKTKLAIIIDMVITNADIF